MCQDILLVTYLEGRQVLDTFFDRVMVYVLPTFSTKVFCVFRCFDQEVVCIHICRQWQVWHLMVGR
jgi:hypothetical protein